MSKKAKEIRPKGGSVSRTARLPKQIDDWLAGKIQAGEYPNYNQAIPGELRKAKEAEERGVQDELDGVCELAAPYGQDVYIRRQIADILEELKETLLKGGGKKGKG